jgi:hypothetical protein
VGSDKPFRSLDGRFIHNRKFTLSGKQNLGCCLTVLPNPKLLVNALIVHLKRRLKWDGTKVLRGAHAPQRWIEIYRPYFSGEGSLASNKAAAFLP